MSAPKKSICVFTASSDGATPRYKKLAHDMGMALTQAGFHVVYGGAKLGMMGALADGVLHHKGSITGVIPDFFHDREISHLGIQDLIKVKTMSERKLLMFDRSDAFLALPGGLGTLDEVFEVLTLNQAGVFKKPCVILNYEGFYSGIIDFLAHANAQGLIRNFPKDTRTNQLYWTTTLEETLEKLKSLCTT